MHNPGQMQILQQWGQPRLTQAMLSEPASLTNVPLCPNGAAWLGNHCAWGPGKAGNGGVDVSTLGQVRQQCFSLGATPMVLAGWTPEDSGPKGTFAAMNV